MTSTPIGPDSIIEGPFWPEPVRVVRIRQHGSVVQIEAVGTVERGFYEQTITLDQLESKVREVIGGTHTFDADPRLFRLAVEALRTHLAHVFDPQFAVSVSQVDPPSSSVGRRVQAHAAAPSHPLLAGGRSWGWQDNHGRATHARADAARGRKTGTGALP